jgi:hypothetical protein
LLKSKLRFLALIFGAQKIAFNQFFEKPIKPKTFTKKIKKIHKTQEKFKTVLKIKNSHMNLKVPGMPEKTTVIRKIAKPNTGNVKKIPFTKKTDLE